MPNLLDEIKDVALSSVYVDQRDLIPSSSLYVDQRDLIPSSSLYVDQRDLTPSSLLYVDQRDLIPSCSKAVLNSYIREGDLDIGQEFVEFEVYKVGKKMEEGDVYCSTPTDSESEGGEDSSAVFKITLQPISNGFIINNSCYLSWRQWHTLISPSISDRLLHCIVCAAYIEGAAGEAHVGTDNHRAALVKFPPLEGLDLTITRRIRNQYHCGVCNEVFDLRNGAEHFNGKMHEGNLLFAINRASDLLDNYGYPTTETKTETYHFKTHKMRNSISASESVNSDLFNDNLNYVNWQNNYQDVDDYEEEFEQPAFTGLSYATMAKKPKAQTQTFLDIDLGNKKVQVRFDSWHMVISPIPNRFWCMVCKKLDSIRNKQEHCKLEEHLSKLECCKVVQEYEEYFIRQVDSKLYHCGHCNNLQLIHEMEDHIETNHPRKATTKILGEATAAKTHIKNGINNGKNNNSNGNNNNSAKNINNNSPMKTNVNKSAQSSINNNSVDKPTNVGNKENVYMNKIATKTVKENNTVPKDSSTANAMNKENFPMNNTTTKTTLPIQDNNKIVHKLPDIFENVEIYPFGYKITISSLAYNIVCRRPNDFYCGLCDFICEEKAILPHVYQNTHFELLHRTPFIAPYSCHLIRAIRDMLHCAICNLPLTAVDLNNHIQDRHHVTNLANALGDVTKPPPPIASTMSTVLDVVNKRTPIVGNMPTVHEEVNKRTPVFGNMPTVHDSINKQAPFGGNTSTVLDNVNKPAPTGSKIPTVVGGRISNVNSGFTNVETPNLGAIYVQTPNLRATNLQVNTNINTLSPNTYGSRQASPKIGAINSPNGSSKLQTSPTKANLGATNVFEYFNANITGAINVSEKSVDQNEQIDLEVKETVETEQEVDEEEQYYSNEEEIDDDSEHDNTFDSLVSEDATFDVEEYVYLKLKNTYIKITNTSYNTLVHIGDGSRYCFVCSLQVQNAVLQRHVDSRPHLENMEKYRFLDKYEDHLLRQFYLMYHCAICNVIITRKELKTHLEWPTHALQNENTMKNIKKTRKNEIKGGIKQIVVFTQKENIYLHEKEPSVKVIFKANVVQSLEKNKKKDEGIRKNKIIIFSDNVLKFPWEHWQGITKIKNGYKCILCQRDLKSAEIDVHCTSEWHKYSLDKPVEQQYVPALIRKINDTTLNCLICNTEVSTKSSIIAEHMNGKRHVRAHEAVLKESAQAHTYADCHQDVLML